jgi:hypothetical protein
VLYGTRVGGWVGGWVDGWVGGERTRAHDAYLRSGTYSAMPYFVSKAMVELPMVGGWACMKILVETNR